jgi:hypothetical protein
LITLFIGRPSPAKLVGAVAAVLTLIVALVVMAPASPSLAAGQGPCDIYAAAGTPCVAAHSTVRALYSSYSGNLYQVRRSSDSSTRNIAVLAAGGYANAAAQDSFCAGTTCVITIIYDQSGHGNDLAYQGSGGAGGKDTPATATTESLTVSGNKVYSLYINPGNSYWHNGSNSGMPKGSSPQGIYMVTSGTHVNSGCCFDYGNSETGRTADGAGAMDAIYFGTSCWFGGCTGAGPWVQADLEYGLFPGGSSSWNPNQRAFTNRYVTAMEKNNGTTQMALKGGNAQSGGLTTLYSGSLPSGYNPMKKQGAIVLGSGGDCCATNTNQSLGTFYEGAIVAGYPSDATENSVQANIVASGYASVSNPFTAGSRVSLQATTSGYTNDYLTHSGTAVSIAAVSSGSTTTAKTAATWIVRSGLGNSSCISFESADTSGSYLRHSGFRLYLNANDGSSLFAQDATFCPVNGNSGSNWSFQSANYSAKYIRHYSLSVYVASNGGSNSWDATGNWTADTTWVKASPWTP